MVQFRRTLLFLLMALLMCIPAGAQAAGKVKVRYKGAAKTYRQKITTVYINGKKKSISTTPIFMKSGTYMGPVDKLFVNSEFKVKSKVSGKKLRLIYKDKKLIVADGTKNLFLNGVYEKKALGAAPMKNMVYTSSKRKVWAVPLSSVCRRLGIKYKVKNGVVYLGKAKETASASDPTDNTSSGANPTDPAVNPTIPAVDASKKVVLVLDAGHGGTDSGAIGAKYREKHLTLAIILAAKNRFDNDNRFKVLYTRTADTYPSLDGRCKLANVNNADLFISVHINAASNLGASGTETLYNNSRNGATKKNGLTSKTLASAMQSAAVLSTGFPNRRLVNRTDLRVLNKTNMPACLIEYGFITNKNEEKIMHANTTKYGIDLYNAIVSFLKSNGKIR